MTLITREVVEARTKMYYEDWLWEPVPSLIKGYTLEQFAEEIVNRIGQPFPTPVDFYVRSGAGWDAPQDPITRELDTLEDIVNAIDQEIERAIA
jgi:hypothetical protein